MGKTKTAFVSDEETNKKLQEKKKARKETKIHISGLKGGQRVKTLDEGPIITESTEEGEQTQEEKKGKVKKHVRGKKYQEVKTLIDRNKLYPLKEAIELAKKASFSKFEGTFEVHLVVKKKGISVNVSLPHSFGKEKKIEVASDETIEKLKSGKVDFDVLLSTAEMMPKLVPFAKILGPKGLMPNPKNQTIIKSASDAKKFSSATMTVKTEKDAPLIHTVFGKANQKEEELIKNFEKIIDTVSAKQIEKVYIKTTMSPSVKVKI